MILSEKFEYKKITFSDRKIIADDFRHILIRLRIGRIGDLTIVIFLGIGSYFNYKNPFMIVLGMVVIMFGISLVRTIFELRKEFSEQHKLVGTFKVLNKRSFKGRSSVEVKFQHIRIPHHFYSKLEIGDCIKVEKLPNGRILRIDKIAF